MRSEKIGSFWVDTANVLIGDPCQVLTDERYQELMEKLFYCDESETIQIAGETLTLPRMKTERFVPLPNRHGADGAFSINTGTDGWYPVYVEYDDDDNPVRIVIEIGRTAP